MKDDQRHIPMKSLAEDDRPREKLISHGRNSVSDAELIAIILGSGNRKETAVQLARRMLADHNNNINLLAKLTINDLKKYNGVGEAKAVNIAAAFELGRRRNETEPLERPLVATTKQAYDVLKSRLSDLPHEEFMCLFLNRSLRLIKQETVSKGGISGTVVDVRLICKAAIENNASYVIVAHNHPSGNLKASDADIKITNELQTALQYFDIILRDHLIIGDERCLSFVDEGLLKIY
jgi:DNA repair protein RadC